MAPNQAAPTTRQEFITLIRSLTTQLEHAEATTSKLEETLSRMRSKEEESGNERERLLTQIMQEKSQRMELERELALTRQALTNSQREAKQHLDTINLTDRINTSSLSQARREAQDWKEQCARSEALRESQGLQIDDLLSTIKEFMARQNAYTPYSSTLRHVGPLISAPIAMATPRVKQEENIGGNRKLYMSIDGDEESVDEEEVAHKPANTRKKRRPEPKNRITESDENESLEDAQSHDEEGTEEEDDELALGYEGHKTTMQADSSTAETYVSQRSVQRKQSTKARGSPQKQSTTYRASEVLLKTPTRPAPQRKNGGRASVGRDTHSANPSAKKRKVGSTSAVSRSDVDDRPRKR
ncbi:hypothetical protein FRC02_002139 [Tulasnella sp. 418]|nr:hypothetical protein FRC02_002139 [Tulasnella sp. 418]